VKSRKLQTNKKNTAKKSTAATKAPAWSGERDYLPICDCSVLLLPWGLVNFCTNRTPLRTIEARSFDMEPLCFNLLSAYKLKSNITTSNSLNTSCIQERKARHRVMPGHQCVRRPVNKKQWSLASAPTIQEMTVQPTNMIYWNILKVICNGFWQTWRKSNF